MASPLPANSTLVFKIPLESSEGINDLGNPSASLAIIRVEACLKTTQGSGQNTTQDAGDIGKLHVKGRISEVFDESGNLLEPRLPSSILPGARATCTVRNAVSTITGEFELMPSLPGAFSTVDEVLGAKIEGKLNTFVGWGDVY